MPGSIRCYPDERPEGKIRKSLWLWWSISVAAIVWIVWHVSQSTPNPMSLWAPILVTPGGVLAGWLFGYKLGFCPLFTGCYLFAKKTV
jgi:hypothetical protein